MLLEIDNLDVSFRNDEGDVVRAAVDVSLTVDRGEILGIAVTKASERKNYFKQTVETLSSLDNVRLLESIIRIDSTVEWSQDNSKPVMAYKKTSRAAQEYMEMAQEVMKYADR